MPFPLQISAVIGMFRELRFRSIGIIPAHPDLVVQNLRSVGPDVLTRNRDLAIPVACDILNTGRIRTSFQVTLTAYADLGSSTQRVAFSQTPDGDGDFRGLNWRDWLIVPPLEAGQSLETFGFIHVPLALSGGAVRLFVKVDDEKLSEDEFASEFGRQRETDETNNASAWLSVTLQNRPSL